MRFSSILVAALPILGSVFAAPVNTEAKTDLSLAPASSALVERDGLLLGALADLKADVTAVGSLSGVTVEADINAGVQAVLDAFNKCGSALGIDLSLGVDATVGLDLGLLKREFNERSVDKQSVAQALIDVIVLVNVNILVPAKPVLSSCTCSQTHSLFTELDLLLTGLLCALDALLGDLLTIVKGLLTSVLGLVAVLLGGLLDGSLSALGF
ncbi:hypothetical protein L202_06821 [Cryptococcus amylolentus CBS 6039]|uniref:Uncharacterized protein n=1 Tax=Cryptococcus amylolentus CBS 6039 TaxID=1295533 RepID=A0A1E3HDM3_9TREE|nr:hypothetical protein L202_06821 [Cryptococcus amylolentus CBS 6039]ODN74424.1 hypothetical protein L202_06821 [Cryptococcus amylolentus CBS 6039]